MLFFPATLNRPNRFISGSSQKWCHFPETTYQPILAVKDPPRYYGCISWWHSKGWKSHICRTSPSATKNELCHCFSSITLDHVLTKVFPQRIHTFALKSHVAEWQYDKLSSWLLGLKISDWRTQYSPCLTLVFCILPVQETAIFTGDSYKTPVYSLHSCKWDNF